MTDNGEVRCDRCGEVCSYEGSYWVCVGCGHRCDHRGRRLKSQPSKAEKVKARFKQSSIFDAEPVRGPVYAPKWIPNFEDPPPTVARRPHKGRGRKKCVPCDRWCVVRAGRVICIKCGWIWEATVL